MSSLQSIIITFLSIGTVGIQILSVLLIGLIMFHYFQPKDKTTNKIIEFISNNYVVLVFIITGLATFGSLVLSEILTFTPCKLCWYQRIFMYPQAVIAGIALFTNDLKIKKYIIPMSLIGMAIAIYHILVQAFPGVISCGDEVVSCSSKQFVGFGYITIPVMSLSAFLLIILISLVETKKK